MTWGYLGKVPNRGDFLTHNVQPAMRDLFFEWCQATMAVSREQLGDEWLDAWLTSPIWHFAAGPGVLAEHGVLGTMIPSVDRVGRHFPFLVLADFAGSTLEAWRQPEWSSQLEDCILGVLDDEWDEASWQHRLALVELPPVCPARLRWPREEGNLMIPAGAEEAEWLRALLERNPELVMWWTQGSAYVEATTLMTSGLPKVGQFASMMVGQWRKHGWQQAALTE
ncbi:type VI secretion system-associated protein TagF [Marinobacter sp.]|uniref:type VI secretion system-associated protein TagF n=1 Tax=Marinobacter sp. TaxID=50741 RepID=UPI00384E6EB6